MNRRLVVLKVHELSNRSLIELEVCLTSQILKYRLLCFAGNRFCERKYRIQNISGDTVGYSEDELFIIYCSGPERLGLESN